MQVGLVVVEQHSDDGSKAATCEAISEPIDPPRAGDQHPPCRRAARATAARSVTTCSRPSRSSMRTCADVLQTAVRTERSPRSRGRPAGRPRSPPRRGRHAGRAPGARTGRPAGPGAPPRSRSPPPGRWSGPAPGRRAPACPACAGRRRRSRPARGRSPCSSASAAPGLRLSARPRPARPAGHPGTLPPGDVRRGGTGTGPHPSTAWPEPTRR